MTKKGYLEVPAGLAQSIAHAVDAERFVSCDRAVKVGAEGAGQRIDHNLVPERRHHHRNTLAKGLRMAEVACGCRVEVERDFAAAIDRPHRPVVGHALGGGMTVEGKQRCPFAQRAARVGDRGCIEPVEIADVAVLR